MHHAPQENRQHEQQDAVDVGENEVFCTVSVSIAKAIAISHTMLRSAQPESLVSSPNAKTMARRFTAMNIHRANVKWVIYPNGANRRVAPGL